MLDENLKCPKCKKQYKKRSRFELSEKEIDGLKRKMQTMQRKAQYKENVEAHRQLWENYYKRYSPLDKEDEALFEAFMRDKFPQKSGESGGGAE